MKRINLQKKLAIFAAALLSFSCRTLQKDIVMSTDSQVQSEEVERVEEKLSFIDAADIMDISDRNELLRECDDLIKDIDGKLKAVEMNKAMASRLYAQKGRLLLIKGKKSDAKKNYNLSLEASKGDSQTLILGSRLGLIKDISDEDLVSGSNQNGLLILESALNYFRDGKFAKSAAKFDEAFLLLPDFYAKSYAKLRDTALASKDHDFSSQSKETVNLLKRPVLTAGQIKKIVKTIDSMVMSSEDDSFVDNKIVYKACYRVLDDGRYAAVEGIADGEYVVRDIRTFSEKP